MLITIRLRMYVPSTEYIPVMCRKRPCNVGCSRDCDCDWLATDDDARARNRSVSRRHARSLMAAADQ